ncbi:TPA: LPS O-antigen chain length determinant protein WzzB [Pseudomonas putida]
MNDKTISQSDEIDLFELVAGLWKRKFLILGVTAAFASGSVIYALTATPIFEAKFYVQAPSSSDIAQLNYGRGGKGGLAIITPKDVYDIYLQSLTSESTRRLYFKDVFLPSLPVEQQRGSKSELYSRFSQQLTISPDAKSSPQRYVVTVQLPDAELAAKWAAGYAQLAGDRALKEILDNVHGDVDLVSRNLEQQISSAQEVARSQRQDTIDRLKESLAIAKAVGPELSRSAKGGSAAGEDSDKVEGPLAYLRGTKALEAEIGTLESRPSDDPFIEGFRGQQAKLEFYRGLKVDSSGIEVYSPDGEAVQPDKPIKPRKTLIVLVGTLMGLVLGSGLALVRHFAGRRR